MAKSNKKNKSNHKIIKIPGAVETGAPKLVELSCNHCGGVLDIADKEHASCPHCGAKYLVDWPEDLNIHIHLRDVDEKNTKAVEKPKKQTVALPKTNESSKKWVGLVWLVLLMLLVVMLKPLFGGSGTALSGTKRTNLLAQFCRDVLGKDYNHITKEDLERVKYIEPYSIERDNQSNYCYVYQYSLTDYKDCETTEDFKETIQTWKSDAISPGQTQDKMTYSKFTGLTAIKLEKSSDSMMPMNAPISCIWVTNLDALGEELEKNSNWNTNQLAQLHVTDQKSEDLSLLSKFPNLECLTIAGSNHDQVIPDLNALASCTKLKELELSFGDAYIGLSTLSNMHDMRRIFLKKVDIDNATFLLDMPELEYLRIEIEEDDNALENLQNLTKLKELILEDGVACISGLPDQPGLKKLICTLRYQEEVDELGRFPSLEYLTMNVDHLHKNISVKELGKLKNLKSVTFGGFFGADYMDMEEIINLPQIEKLSIYHNATSENKVVRIHPERLNDESTIKKFTCMKYVFVNSSSGEVDWSFFNVMKNVEDVTLYKCNLEDLSFLSGLPKVKILELEQNQIKDYSPLTECPSLCQIYTWGNPTIDANLGENVEVIPHENIDHWY